MWGVAEGNHAVVRMLIDRGAGVNARSKFVPSATGRGFEGATPVAARPNQSSEENASGSLTPLMFAAREGDLESARMLVGPAQKSMREAVTEKTLWDWPSSMVDMMSPRS